MNVLWGGLGEIFIPDTSRGETVCRCGPWTSCLRTTSGSSWNADSWFPSPRPSKPEPLRRSPESAFMASAVQHSMLSPWPLPLRTLWSWSLLPQEQSPNSSRPRFTHGFDILSYIILPKWAFYKYLLNWTSSLEASTLFHFWSDKNLGGLYTGDCYKTMWLYTKNY